MLQKVWRAGAAATLVALAVGAQGAVRVAAQVDHPGQYTQAEIDTGARVYNAQCGVCHGMNGDQVSGIDLRRGQFRRASSDEDLARVITLGVPGTGMPPFALQAPELNGVIAFIRAGLYVASRLVRIGNAAPRKAVLEWKGA